MRYHIDTIPVWDALHLDSECLLCALKRKTERQLVERSLGGKVMSPDARIKVNELGFCGHHQQLLYAQPGGNRLGHGLMMLSHLQTLRPRVEKALQSGRTEAGKASIFAAIKKSPAAEGAAISGFAGSCVLCQELAVQCERHLASLIHLWGSEEAFRQAFIASRGLCLSHTEQALAQAPAQLSGQLQSSFTQAVKQLLTESLKRLEEELDWFTQKFDYRNAQAPWGQSRDALERTINKLQGWCLGSEPMQDES